MSETFLKAIHPYNDRIKEFFKTQNYPENRFDLWVEIMSRFTTDLNSQLMYRFCFKAFWNKPKVCVVIPERMSPRHYISEQSSLLEFFKKYQNEKEKFHLIISGGVKGQRSESGRYYNFGPLFGEYPASEMFHLMKKEYNHFQAYGFSEFEKKWSELISKEQVTLDDISQNTGDQAWIVASALLAQNPDFVIFLGPAEHIPRFALTIRKAMQTIKPVLRQNYLNRFENMKALVLPIHRGNGWNSETDLKGMTETMDAFGPLDDRMKNILPKKRRGQELVERILNEMYGENAKNFTMNVQTLEEAATDPFWIQLEGISQQP